MLTAEYVEQILEYDPDTGDFVWLDASAHSVKVGDVAGRVRKGRLVLCIDKEEYQASHIAWLYMTGVWPSQMVDHKDLNPMNNSWDNLRLATPAQNKWNSRKPSTNTSGYKGVSYHKGNRKFSARLMKNKKNYYLGDFDTAEEAHEAYCLAAKTFHGEFARTE